MQLSRREALAFGALTGGALLLPLERSVQAAAQSRLAESALPAPFTAPFAVPPTAKPVRIAGNTDFYSMTMREQSTQIIPGFRTRIWGYNGSFPGPTIDVQQGREVYARHINQLPATHAHLGYTPTTSVHLHGSASLPQFDGYANDITRPGAWKDYRYPNIQDGRTLWYHDHGVHHTAPNVYMGLAGMYRVFDPLGRSLPLPQGIYDVPLIISDALFDTEGQLLFDDGDQSGLFGDVILVNGRPWPLMKVQPRKYRFRLLNASVSRSYRLRLDSGEPLVVIATDGGFTDHPKSVDSLILSGGERYEVIIDFAKYRRGERIVLENVNPRNNVRYTHTDKIMAFEVARSVKRANTNNSIPDVLNPDCAVMALEPTPEMTRRTISLDRQGGEWTINELTWQDVVDTQFTQVLANPGLNDVEVWEIQNDSGGWHHPLHIHLVDVKVLSREIDIDGVLVPAEHYEEGPKDVIHIGENERVRVITKFGPQVGRYMVHCHNLVHEDHDMMGQIEVGTGGANPMTTAPSQPLPAPPL
ncbi:bilirubin oxidase [Knoellia sinensis KCTC 19936]|uniref:Bilirubin oxidase n=1 Tax=Knoellia sinensis KCTC 19936 TaxID=1385520 RepID=A0A0A0J3B0_9MICO|nr:multicopper oxidase family protein [Knoellia sinensis]KGN31653.1 bilirubin oxidase [Knoellia sinensis KCTC 19936]